MCKWKAVSRLFGILLVLTPLLTGCWDRSEIETRGTILGIALDTVASETENSNLGQEMGQSDATGSGEVSIAKPTFVRLTAQIAVPGRIPLGPGGGGGGGTESPQQAVWVLHAVGKTPNDALQQLQQQLADKIFLGHLRVIVVSEAYARQRGLETLADTLRRNPEVRRTAWLIVSKGQAAKIMTTAPPLERVPTLYLMSTMDHARDMGKVPNEFFGMFASKSVMKGREPVLPYVEILEKDNINMAGLALFKNYKMVGTTEDPFDIASYMELSGVKKAGYTVMVRVPGISGAAVMWQAYRRQTKIRVDIRNGHPYITEIIHIDGNVVEKSDESFNLNDPKMIRTINHELERSTQIGLKQFIDLTKQDDVDVVGYGEYVRARKPQYWDRYIQTKEKWEKLYPNIPVEIHLSVKTHRVGMKEV